MSAVAHSFKGWSLGRVAAQRIRGCVKALTVERRLLDALLKHKQGAGGGVAEWECWRAQKLQPAAQGHSLAAWGQGYTNCSGPEEAARVLGRPGAALFAGKNTKPRATDSLAGRGPASRHVSCLESRRADPGDGVMQLGRRGDVKRLEKASKELGAPWIVLQP